MSCSERLRYNSLSLVYLQVFTYEEFDSSLLKSPLYTPIPNSIDKQIFELDDNSEAPVKRYRLKSFPFELTLIDDSKKDETKEKKIELQVIEGLMHVEMSLFFDRTVSLTYRLVIDEPFCKRMNALPQKPEEEKKKPMAPTCKSRAALSTDELISLSALRMGAEHWSCEEEGSECKTASNINIKISKFQLSKFHLDNNGELLTEGKELIEESLYLSEIQKRYKKFIFNSQRENKRWQKRKQSLNVLNSKIDLSTYHGDYTKDLNYVLIDIWEDLSATGNEFKKKREEDIISHIYQEHKRELIGLMSLYPYEWPYRTIESFDDVCGSNVAIDIDDLILVNQNICVVFGTYGLRGEGAATDWEDHLRNRSHYHVSWPEYLMILEMVLAKKYTMIAVSDLYLKMTLKLSSLRSTRKLIEENAKDSMRVATILLNLDAVKYSRYISHMIMYERTAKRLNIDREAGRLDDIMKKIDNSLLNISDMRKLQYSSQLNILLGVISAASLLAFLFHRLEVPFTDALGLGHITNEAGFTIITISILLLLGFIVQVIIMNFRNNRLK